MWVCHESRTSGNTIPSGFGIERFAGILGFVAVAASVPATSSHDEVLDQRCAYRPVCAWVCEYTGVRTHPHPAHESCPHSRPRASGVLQRGGVRQLHVDLACRQTDRLGVRMGEGDGVSVRCLDLACQPRPGPGRHCPACCVFPSGMGEGALA